MSNPLVAFFVNQIRKDIRDSLRHWAKELGKDKFRLAVKIFYNPDSGEVEYDLVEGFQGEGQQIVWEKLKSMIFNEDILLLPPDGADMYGKEEQLKPHLGTALEKFTAEFNVEQTQVFVVAYLVEADNDMPTFCLYVKGAYKRVIDIDKEFLS